MNEGPTKYPPLTESEKAARARRMAYNARQYGEMRKTTQVSRDKLALQWAHDDVFGDITHRPN